MSDPLSKRRKIRPNNVIALSNALKEAPLKKVEEPVIETNIKETSQPKVSKKTKGSRTKKASKKKSTVKRKAKELDSDAEKNAPTEPIANVSFTPIPRYYSSASDSDETDDEKRQTRAVNKPKGSTPQLAPASKLSTPQSAPASKLSTPAPEAYSSASDSDETDDEKRTSKVVKPATPKVAVPKVSFTKISPPKAPLPALSTPAPRSFSSASDSDETDDEKSAARAKTIREQATQKKGTASVLKTSKYVVDSDAESDESDPESDNQNAFKLDTEHRASSHLVNNRISFRKKSEYDKSLTAAENVTDRLSDLFVPQVNDNFFISDSESDTDSGEDYEAKYYPSWQRNLERHHNKETDPWPTQRKFGYSDTLALEKRIKKICRREKITFSEVQDIFTKDRRSEYIRFFQKIAKPFPNVSLAALARQCKNMYHHKKKNSPWTPEEVVQLEELIKVYGTSPTVLSQHMERSPKNISDYLFSHSKSEKKVVNRWKKEEDDILLQVVRTLKPGEKPNYSAIEHKLGGTRTTKQIHARFYRIRHLVQPDGTLKENRKATLYEELKYLKRLLKQVKEHKLAEESQLDFTKDRGFVDRKFYLSSRAAIKGFERMNIKDILKNLIEKQNKVIASRREENLLGSDPEPDQE